MAMDYALIHAKYTIPPALLLSYLYYPFSTRLDVYRVVFLITIAVVSTVPWDSYLIRHSIWSYPPDAIVGPTVYDIPAEELFFFVIQTYNTSLLYLILNKASVHPAYLRPTKNESHGTRHAITAGLACTILAGVWMIRNGGETSYMGLILAWAAPFALSLFSLCGSFILRLPLRNTVLPIVIPTVYLWVVDTIALRNGTWVIEVGTKLGWEVVRGLEIEEAVFFVATNVLVVFGLLAFDKTIAVLNANPALFPVVAELPSPITMMRALLVAPSQYDFGRIRAIQEADRRLQRKSRSFHFASAFFRGRLRIDLMLLYSFCRVADDLVDNARDRDEAFRAVAKLREFLDLRYRKSQDGKSNDALMALVEEEFPRETHSALLYLPTDYLPSAPLYSLLDGFEIDLKFGTDATKNAWPIAEYKDLERYAECVAGTIAELCLALTFHHTTTTISPDIRQDIIKSGERMGVALQYVNIARDIETDARIERVYLPTTWLKETGLVPTDVLTGPNSENVMSLRAQLLKQADRIYKEARPAIEALPAEARAPMRVAVESYMEIGRVLKSGKYRVRAGRATVPKVRRFLVGWRALRRG